MGECTEEKVRSNVLYCKDLFIAKILEEKVHKDMDYTNHYQQTEHHMEEQEATLIMNEKHEGQFAKRVKAIEAYIHQIDKRVLKLATDMRQKHDLALSYFTKAQQARIDYDAHH